MKRIIAFLLVATLLLPMTLLAGPGGHRGKGMKGGNKEGSRIGHLLMMSDKLELSEKQISELKEMAVDFQMERIDRKADLSKAQVTLRSLMHDEDAAQVDVERNIDKVAGLKANMKKMQYAHRKTVGNLLSDDQKDKLKTLQKERAGKFGDGGPHGKMGGMGRMGDKCDMKGNPHGGGNQQGGMRGHRNCNR